MPETSAVKRVPAFGLPTKPVGNGPEILQVLNPVADPATGNTHLAPRLDTLEGKRVAFIWNGKPGGDIALKRVREKLVGRFPDLKPTHFYFEAVASAGIPLDKVMETQPEAVVTSTAD
jgi:hypothetical protein